MYSFETPLLAGVWPKEEKAKDDLFVLHPAFSK